MTRRILAAFVALVFAAIGTAAVLLYVQRADDRAVAAASPVTVLVAKQRIPAGTTGESIRNSGLVEPLRMPAGSLPDGETLTELPTEVDKMVVTSDLQPGQLVLRRMFSQSTRTSGGLAIPEGLMAVTVEATVAEQVAGYVRPGSQVTVFVTYRVVEGKTKSLGTAGGADVTGAAVLLPKVEVIAVGEFGEGGQTTTTPLDGPTTPEDRNAGKKTVLVTMAVDTRQAAKLIHAADADALYLALLTDSSRVAPGAGVDSSTFLG
jgi:pilus assembly protein CpaB